MRRRQRGFTLVEVLAAMAIFSVGIAGVLASMAQNARTIVTLKDKTYADIVADNILIQSRQSLFLEEEEEGESVIAGDTFEWTLSAAETEQPGFYRLQIDVRRPDQTRVLVRRSAYVNGDE